MHESSFETFHCLGMKESLGSENIRVVDGDTIIANGKKIRLKGNLRVSHAAAREQF